MLAEERRLAAARVLDEADEPQHHRRRRDQDETRVTTQNRSTESIRRIDPTTSTASIASFPAAMTAVPPFARLLRTIRAPNASAATVTGTARAWVGARADQANGDHDAEKQQDDVAGNDPGGAPGDRELHAWLVDAFDERDGDGHEEQCERRVPGLLQGALTQVAHRERL